MGSGSYGFFKVELPIGPGADDEENSVRIDHGYLGIYERDGLRCCV